MPSKKIITAYGYKTNNQENTFFVDRALGIIEQKAIDITNKLESIPFNDPEIPWYFYQIRQELSKKISKKGSAILVYLPLNIDNRIIVANEPLYKMTLNRFTWLQFTTNDLTTYNNLKYPILYRYEFTSNGNVKLTKFIEIQKNNEEQQEYNLSIDTYNVQEIPAQLFRNNMQLISDIEVFGVKDEIDYLIELCKHMYGELQLSLAMLYSNKALSGGEDAVEKLEKLKGGKRVVETNSFGAKFGNADQLVAGVSSSVVLQNEILFVESDIYSKLNLDIPNLSHPKTNKHSLEVIMSNKHQLRELEIKRVMREREYKAFFTKINEWGIKINVNNIILQKDSISESLDQILKLLVSNPTGSQGQ